MKRYLLIFLKLAIPVAVIAWLLSRLEPEQVDELLNRDKDWARLAAAFVLTFALVMVSFVRWWLLVWTLGLPFRLRDAFRLGFLGYLLNFVSVGVVGGDLFKAVFIAREQPGRRAEAVATVLVDRVVGFYALLVVASSAILLAPPHSDHAALQAVCQATLVVTAVGGVGIALLMLPGLTHGRFAQWAGGLPLVGPAVQKVMAGLRLYKSRPLVMALIAGMSLSVHVTLGAVMWLIAGALFHPVPTLAEHLVITPLAMAAGALPFTPSGLGVMEAAMSELYRVVPDAARQLSGGVLVALAYRLITIGIAGVGAVFYVTGRREVQQVMQEGKRIQAEEEKAAGPHSAPLAQVEPSSSRAHNEGPQHQPLPRDEQHQKETGAP